MAVHYRTQGFVFKKEDKLEADRMFTVFTKDFGKIEVFAKAIRKITSKLRGGIEIFSLSELSFIQGKNKKTLTDTILLDALGDAHTNIEELGIMHKISTVLDSFIKGEERDEKIWNLILDIFNTSRLMAPITNNDLRYYYFFWNFISLLGYKPELYLCAMCRQKLEANNLYFSDKEGGVLCQRCHEASKESKKINSDMVKILRLILNGGWQVLSKLKIESASMDLLEKISDDYYLYLESPNAR
jgi:DNA repair protein RecO (recombination protein O)